jgi:hypothetical protein
MIYFWKGLDLGYQVLETKINYINKGWNLKGLKMVKIILFQPHGLPSSHCVKYCLFYVFDSTKYKLKGNTEEKNLPCLGKFLRVIKPWQLFNNFKLLNIKIDVTFDWIH